MSTGPRNLKRWPTPPLPFKSGNELKKNNFGLFVKFILHSVYIKVKYWCYVCALLYLLSSEDSIIVLPDLLSTVVLMTKKHLKVSMI